jgi:hypothetical protein
VPAIDWEYLRTSPISSRRAYFQVIESSMNIKSGLGSSRAKGMQLWLLRAQAQERPKHILSPFSRALLKNPDEAGGHRNRSRQTTYGGGTAINRGFPSVDTKHRNGFLRCVLCFFTH